MRKVLYTVVCRYYTINGIIELDLYDVFRRLHIKPYNNQHSGKTWDEHQVVRKHVYAGLAVEYKIKKVVRTIDITEETRYFYSYYSPYSIMYECLYDLKDVENMNNESITVRMNMTDDEFKKIFGGKV